MTHMQRILTDFHPLPLGSLDGLDCKIRYYKRSGEYGGYIVGSGRSYVERMWEHLVQLSVVGVLVGWGGGRVSGKTMGK